MEQFSNRWGLILASLGMAIGAGNLWRFPRLAGQYGGTFLLLWLVFVIVWSVPILLAEFSIGKHYKQGVVGSLANIGGKKFAWIGVFIAGCSLGIAFYYGVVTAWGLHYLTFSVSDLFANLFGNATLSQNLQQNPEFLENEWKTVSNANFYTIILLIFGIFISCFTLYKGVQKGLELANKVLIPSLFVLLLIISAYAISRENGVKGLEYMYEIRSEFFLEPKVWLEALSQSAWSTGAGWGLVLTISSYSRQKEDVTLNTLIACFGNNVASLLSGMAVLPAVFSLAASEQSAISYLQQGNQALLFTIIPKLFTQMTGGIFLSVLFFAAFFMAAFTSLLSMLELFIKLIMDFGINRQKSTILAGVIASIFGIPSAYSLAFFSNQDWVWGLGLIISGLLMIFVVIKYGIEKFKTEWIDKDSDFHFSNIGFKILMFLNIFLGVLLIFWWMSQGYSQHTWFDENGNWNVLDVYSNATIITQWSLLIILALLLNRWAYQKFVLK
ncbi:MAG: sodium-dependent transporter [Bacteroidetes bacterium]|nr:MAG: sodium-dependent transporter [Bacteroidota bacterium]